MRLGMTVGEMLDRMSSHELAEWEAFFRLEAEDAGPGGRHALTREEDILAAFRSLAGGGNANPR